MDDGPSPLALRPDLIEPEALSRLRDALIQGERSGLLWRMLQRLEAWCAGPLEQAQAEAGSVDRALLDKALALMRNAATQAMGLTPGPDWAERAAAFDARPHGAEEAAALARYMRCRAIGDALGPAPSGKSPAMRDAALGAEIDRLYRRQTELVAHTVPGELRIDSLAALDALLADYARLRALAGAEDEALPYLDFHAGSVAYALGRGRGLNGELTAASDAYAKAADLYEAAGEPDQALDAREEAARTRFAVHADIDGASLADLASLAAGIDEPVERARALLRLSDRAREANDGFTALALAEAALTALAAAGFPEPAGDRFAEATARWIDTAAARATGNALTRRLIWVGTEMLRTRALRSIVRPDGAAAAQPDSDRLTELLRLLLDEQSAVVAAIHAGLAGYGLILDDDAPLRSDATDQATELLRRIGDAATVEEAEALEVAARAIGMATITAQACLQVALLRLDAGDAAGAIAAAADGEGELLGGRDPARLIGLRDLDILLELRRQRLGALAMSGDAQGVFDWAWPTVQLVEAARYRISNPVQQAAFLAQRTAFYELTAFSAFKLARWDELLVAMDLFKARAAVRNRLAPPPDADAQALAAELSDVTQALAAATAEDRPALAARRRAIWDLLTVVRFGRVDPADLPELSVAAVQASLASEEAAVSWSFVGTGVLIVFAVTPTAHHCERVILDAEEQSLLADYVAAMEGGRVRNRALGRTVTRLAAAILPPATRTFIAGATRLIFSPHRQLNLLPLHAARLDDAYLIERAAVRYVPNLGCLLLPWHGGGSGVVAVGVDRTAVPGWPPLAHAEAEAEATAAAWRMHGVDTACLTGADATVAAVTGLDLGAARCIHLATHGSSVLLGSAAADPFASHLVLHDGVLDALAISQLSLRAEIVVMSACFSGQRSLALGALAELPGDDLFGLQAAFLQAGARSVIGALWPLVDETAARILPAMSARLAAGIAPDLALQEAVRAELAARPAADIYAWAALFINSIGRMAAF